MSEAGDGGVDIYSVIRHDRIQLPLCLLYLCMYAPFTSALERRQKKEYEDTNHTNRVGDAVNVSLERCRERAWHSNFTAPLRSHNPSERPQQDTELILRGEN